MKTIKYFLYCFIITLSFVSCDDDDTDQDFTGRVIITIDNESLFNQDDFFVQAGIVFQESDSGLFENFGRNDISRGGMVAFEPIDLNVGNYYVRFQYFVGSSTSGGVRHRPFQVRGGEDTLVEIVR